MSIGEKQRWGGVYLVVLLIGVCAAYGVGLGEVGMLGPDEPRYASIGREMARSGDWLTPVLWGEAWFEKPPLLYWLVGAGFRLGLGENLAPRLPVVLVSVVFLGGFFVLVGRLYGERVAMMATLLLSATAGWAAYSQIAVTDLPLAATFVGGVLLGMVWLEGGGRGALLGSAACFGLAVLAKGLVPGVLGLPLLWFARKRWRELGPGVAVFALIAVPWFALMSMVHGWGFVEEFFLRHHLSRFASPTLQHVQPFWFYVPVLIGGMFPVSPLLGTIAPHCWRARELRALAVVAGFGFVFFSMSTNKLPGYILPLVPLLCILIAHRLGSGERAVRGLLWSTMLVGLCPVIVTILPESLMYGLRRANLGELEWVYFLAVAPFGVGVWYLERRGWRVGAVAVMAAAAGLGLVYVKLSAGPALDNLVSARGLWGRVEAQREAVCVERLHRSLRYGLNYYSVAPLPDCEGSGRPVAVRQKERALPRLEPRAAGSF